MHKPVLRSATLMLAAVLMLTTSCSSFKYLHEPLAKSIPASVHPGNTVRFATYRVGVNTGKLTVKQVWADSLLVGNDTKAVPYSSIAHFEKRKFDPVLTLVALSPLVVLIVLASDVSIPSSGFIK